MSARLSGVEAISPAMERTKRQLFVPFQFRHWSRLAIVVMSTGELTGGGGSEWSSLSRLPGAAGGGSGGQHFFEVSSFPGLPDVFPTEYLPWIVGGVFLLVLFGFAFLYVASVFRFILFDSVLNGRCELGAGWRRWQKQGVSYFFWVLGFGLAGLAAILVLVGLPIYLAWAAGIFYEPAEHVVLLVIGGLLLLGLMLGLILVGALASMFARDFVVPVMALEDLGVLEGWRQVLPMLGAEKGAFTIYVLMKIGLGMGSAVLFGIINFVVLLVLLLPLGLVALIVLVAAGALGMTWNTLTICLVVLAGGIIVMLLVYVLCLVSTPAMVFFQSYTLHFFGARYRRLGELVDATTPPSPSGPYMPGAAPFPAT